MQKCVRICQGAGLLVVYQVFIELIANAVQLALWVIPFLTGGWLASYINTTVTPSLSPHQVTPDIRHRARRREWLQIGVFVVGFFLGGIVVSLIINNWHAIGRAMTDQ